MAEQVESERTKQSRYRPLPVRLFAYVMIVGLTLAAVAALYNLLVNRRVRNEQVERVLDSIEVTYLPAITQSTYAFDTDQLGLLLEGIVLLDDISHARAVELGLDGDLIIEARGQTIGDEPPDRSYPLVAGSSEEQRLFGRLEVWTSGREIRRLSQSQLLTLVVSSAIPVLAVSILIWIILEHSVVRHLRHIAKSVGTIRGPEDGHNVVTLDRRSQPDELAEIVRAINAAYSRLTNLVEERGTLLRELYHRTKNNMQTVSALLEMKAARFSESAEIKSMVTDVNLRIQAMAMVHDKLYDSKNLWEISAYDYLADLVVSLKDSYGADHVQAVVEAEPVPLSVDTALPLGLVVAELVSNSLKHGFPSERPGTIRVRLFQRESGTVCLSYTDSGVGLPASFDPREDGGDGMRTMIALCEHQLGGTVGFEAGEGFSFSVEFTDDQYPHRVPDSVE